MNDSEEKTCKCNEEDDSKQPILVPDVIRSILERLSLVDFRRARCVSSDFYYASKSCIEVTHPLIILFTNDSCKLFDPRDHISYTISVRDVGFDFVGSRCLASSGSWFLMLDHSTNFHILNLFTRETIPLPSLESIDGWQMQFRRLGNSDFWVTLNYGNKDSEKNKTSYMAHGIGIYEAVLWVVEKSRDYLAVWNYDGFLAYQKKGDDNKIWKVLGLFENLRCSDMVFKESKLYVLSKSLQVTVFDFSRGDSPMECASFKTPYVRYPYEFKLVVTLSGEVLIISCRFPERRYGDVYKMDPKSSEWSINNSVGDEALFPDLGITVAAEDGVLLKNCMYFNLDLSNRYNWRNAEDSILVYHLKTKKVVQVFQPLTASSPIRFVYARWFFPT